MITGSGELMKEIDRRLRVIDQVIRHLVVRVDEETARRRSARTDARKTIRARRRVARGLPPERQPGEGRGDGDSEDDDGRGGGPAMSGRTSGGGGRGRDKDKKDGKGGEAPRRGFFRRRTRVQVLRGEDRLHQLQGREAARAVPAGARQDSAAADFRHVRAAPAQAAGRRSSARASWR